MKTPLRVHPNEMATRAEDVSYVIIRQTKKSKQSKLHYETKSTSVIFDPFMRDVGHAGVVFQR